VEWDPSFSEPLYLDPFTKSYFGRKKIAHYFLLVASITESTLIGRAENARALLTYLHKVLEADIFEVIDEDVFTNLLSKFTFCSDLGEENEEIPRVLTSVNGFARAQRNLGSNFNPPNPNNSG